MQWDKFYEIVAKYQDLASPIIFSRLLEVDSLLKCCNDPLLGEEYDALDFLVDCTSLAEKQKYYQNLLKFKDFDNAKVFREKYFSYLRVVV